MVDTWTAVMGMYDIVVRGRVVIATSIIIIIIINSPDTVRIVLYGPQIHCKRQHYLCYYYILFSSSPLVGVAVVVAAEPLLVCSIEGYYYY